MAHGMLGCSSPSFCGSLTFSKVRLWMMLDAQSVCPDFRYPPCHQASALGILVIDALRQGSTFIKLRYDNDAQISIKLTTEAN